MTNRRSPTTRLGWALAALTLAGVALTTLALSAAARAADSTLRLVFVYGSEKKEWLEDVTKDYQATNPTVNGRPIKIGLVPMGSGETVDAVLNAQPVTPDGLQADLISPASMAYLVLGNARAVSDGKRPIVGPAPVSLVRSPVVIAMWRPKAEALGWPDKPIGWKTLRDLAANKDGWKSVGHPEWHNLKLGHTHPEQSNSGLITLLSEAYAAAGKKQGLTVADVQSAATTSFLTDLEHASPVYGSSTGFFANQMFGAGGDSFVNAAVMYENLVIESYGPKFKGKLQDPVVAIYPEEGTFWSDHPVAVVQREWVTQDPDKAKAAQDYIDFLLRPAQQKKALTYGFRPAVAGVPVGAPIDAAHGVDPTKPAPADVLQPPDADVMEACLKAWRATKKKANVVLVFDASNDMNMKQGNYLFSAEDGAYAVIDALAEGDTVSVLTFNDETSWLKDGKNVELKGPQDKQDLKKAIENGIGCKGGRRLYDAIDQAHKFLDDNAPADTISAVFVLTKATPDNRSQLTLDSLKNQIQGRNKPNRSPVYIFTFAYGSDKGDMADKMKAIVGCTRGDAKFGDLEDKTSMEKIRGVIKGFAYLF